MNAKMAAPFGVLGIATRGDFLAGIEFLPPGTLLLDPSDPFTREVCIQIGRYLDDPRFEFDLPLLLSGTSFRKRVWEKISEIPAGRTRRYGEIAKELGTAARAVGQACGANPVPLVIPCHRVVSGSGLGGFMHHGEGHPLLIKEWLLSHESD